MKWVRIVLGRVQSADFIFNTISLKAISMLIIKIPEIRKFQNSRQFIKLRWLTFDILP